MSNTESKIKLIFEGAERGVGMAAAKAKLAIKSVSDENDRLTRAGDKAESALMGIGKGLLAVSSVGSAATTIAGVAAAATQASGALLLLPGALAAVKIGLGAIDMGAGDFLAAMGNLNDNKAFKKNMEAMGDSAKGVAGQIKIAHDSLAEGLGEKMFAGLEAKLKPLIASTLPQLKASYDSIAVSVNRTGHEILDMLNKSDRQADLNKLIKDSGAIWDQLLKSVVPLGSAFLDIAVVGTEVLKDLTGGIGGAAKRFADFIAKARESQQLERWINTGVNAFKDMWHIVENVGSTIGSVFKGLGTSMGSPLKMLRDLTDRMAEFMNSAAAQDGLRILGDGLRAIGEGVGQVAKVALSEIAQTLVALAPVAGTVAQTLGTLLVAALTVLGPVIRTIADILAEFPFVTVAATTALLGFVVVMKSIKAVNAVSELLGLGTAIGGAGDKAKAAEGKVRGFAGGLGLIKGALAVGAVAALAVEMDKVNAASEQGNLSGWNGELHDIVRILSGDWGNPIADINAQLGEVNAKWSAGQAPVQQWALAVGQAATTAGTAIQNFFRGLVGLPPLPPVKLDVDPATGQAKVDEFVGGVSRTRGTAHLDAEPSGANSALASWKGSASATTGQAHVDAEAGRAHGKVAEWKGATDRTTAQGHVTAETSSATATMRRWVSVWNGYHISVGVGAVVSSRIGGMATGGPVSGPGTGTSDTAGLYALSNGEYVATAQQVANAGGPAAFGRLMDALEHGTTRMASGGPVGSGGTGLLAAMNELLARARSGGSIFEDMSFKGMSKNLAEFNDKIADSFEKQGQALITWLEQQTRTNSTTQGTSSGLGDVVKLGQVSDAVWDSLLKQGWKGRAGDNMEALYRPAMKTPAPSGGSGPGVVTVNFIGNTSDALATVIMGMIRQGKIQIKAA